MPALPDLARSRPSCHSRVPGRARLRVELLDVRAEEATDLVPRRRDRAAEQRQPDARVHPPQRRAAAASGDAELDHPDPPARFDHARELAHRRGAVVDVAQQVGERQRVELAVGERELLGLALDERDARRSSGCSRQAAARAASMCSLWSSADDLGTRAAPARRRPARCRWRRRACAARGGGRSRRRARARQRGSWPKLSTAPIRS